MTYQTLERGSIVVRKICRQNHGNENLKSPKVQQVKEVMYMSPFFSVNIILKVLLTSNFHQNFHQINQTVDVHKLCVIMLNGDVFTETYLIFGRKACVGNDRLTASRCLMWRNLSPTLFRCGFDPLFHSLQILKVRRASFINPDL